MGVTFGDRPCLAPEQELANVRELAGQGLMVRTEPWAGRANSFRCPLGPSPGQGWILLLRRDLDELGLDTPRDLVFSHDQDGNSVTLKTLYPVRAGAVLPGLREDLDGAWWVELADRRRIARASAVNAAYNVRSSYASAAYFSATLNGGTPWTWTQLVEQLWTAVGAAILGSYPGLPFTPDGTPENWSFYGACAYDALNEVLARIGCALALDPVADTFDIVQVSEDDTGTVSALGQLDGERTWDAEWLQSTAAIQPATLRVFFAKHRTTADTTGGSPWYTVDVTDPDGTPSTTVAGTVAMVRDDLPAQYDSSGTLTNAAALATRASERAADYFRRARQERRHRTYTGLRSEVGIRPGSQVQATLWEDRGQGLLTTLVSVDGLPLPARPMGGPEGGADVGYGSAARVLESTQDAWDTTQRELGTHELARDYEPLVYQLQAQGLIGVSVDTVDGTPSYTGIATLRFDETDGFSLTNPSTGVVRIDLLSASAVQAGVVDTTTQTFAGDKSFAASVTVQGLCTLRGGLSFYAANHGNPGSGDITAWDPSTPGRYVFNSLSGDATIHGQIDHSDGLLFQVWNYDSTYKVTLKHESASAVAADRFSLPGGADVVLGYLDYYTLIYDETIDRWTPFSGYRSQMAMSDVLAFAAAHG